MCTVQYFLYFNYLDKQNHMNLALPRHPNKAHPLWDSPVFCSGEWTVWCHVFSHDLPRLLYFPRSTVSLPTVNPWFCWSQSRIQNFLDWQLQYIRLPVKYRDVTTSERYIPCAGATLGEHIPVHVTTWILQPFQPLHQTICWNIAERELSFMGCKENFNLFHKHFHEAYS